MPLEKLPLRDSLPLNCFLNDRTSQNIDLGFVTSQKKNYLSQIHRRRMKSLKLPQSYFQMGCALDEEGTFHLERSNGCAAPGEGS